MGVRVPPSAQYQCRSAVWSRRLLPKVMALADTMPAEVPGGYADRRGGWSFNSRTGRDPITGGWQQVTERGNRKHRPTRTLSRSTTDNLRHHHARRWRRPPGCSDRGTARRPADHDAVRPGPQEPRPAPKLHPRGVHGLGNVRALIGWSSVGSGPSRLFVIRFWGGERAADPGVGRGGRGRL